MSGEVELLMCQPCAAFFVVGVLLGVFIGFGVCSCCCRATTTTTDHTTTTRTTTTTTTTTSSQAACRIIVVSERAGAKYHTNKMCTHVVRARREAHREFDKCLDCCRADDVKNK